MGGCRVYASGELGGGLRVALNRLELATWGFWGGRW